MQPIIRFKTLIDIPLGEALVRQGVITQTELERALEIQKHRESQYLGEILQKDLGVSQNKINETLDYLSKRRKIGDILIDLGLITHEELKRVLREQKEIQTLIGIKRPLGILLFHMGLIKYADYMKALSKHFVLPIISLNNCRISSSLQDVLGKKYVCKNQVVVLENDGHNIKIALGEPTPPLMQEIRKTIPAHIEIFFYLAHPLDINSAHKIMFDLFHVHNKR
jgi:hypothetical protein